MYHIKKKDQIKNLNNKPKYEKNIITIEYPISNMNRKYLQNIDLLYIEECFKVAEQEYLKNANTHLDSYITIDEPVYEPTNYENKIISLEENNGMQAYIMKEILPIKVTQVKSINRKEIKCITKKYIEIIQTEDTSI